MCCQGIGILVCSQPAGAAIKIINGEKVIGNKDEAYLRSEMRSGLIYLALNLIPKVGRDLFC